MKDIFEDYRNDTDEIQTFTDFSGKPVTVKVGETVPILVGRELVGREAEVVPSSPAELQIDERKFVNLYKAPKA